MLDPIVAFFVMLFQWIGRGIGLLVGVLLWPFLWFGRWYAQKGWTIKLVFGAGIALLAGTERRCIAVLQAEAAALAREPMVAGVAGQAATRLARGVAVEVGRAGLGDQPEGGGVDQPGLAPLGLRTIDEQRADALRQQQRHGHGQQHLAHQASRP